MASSRNPAPSRSWGPRLVLALALSTLASSAAAHDMWIIPPEAEPGDLVEIFLREGELAYPELSPRNKHHLVRFAAVGPFGKELAVVGANGSDPAGVFRPDEAGLWAVLYESVESFSMLPPRLFAAFLEDHGLDSILELRRQRGEEGDPGRELYTRLVKSVFPVGDATAADRAVGLPLEMVIETESKRWSDGTLRLRLFLRGEPLADAQVAVQEYVGGERVAVQRTDGEGYVDFELGPGAWMASVIQMEPDESAAPRAEWRSMWATLTWVIDPPTAATGDQPLEAQRTSSTIQAASSAGSR
jgi:uncharacterized GH25 family protein